MNTKEDYLRENADLRAKLEKQKPGCTNHVPISQWNEMATVDQYFFNENEALRKIENGLLRDKLEAECPGCCAAIPFAMRDVNGCSTEFKERAALNTVKAALASLKTINARGAAVAASYHAQPNKPALSADEQAVFDQAVAVNVAKIVFQLGITDHDAKAGGKSEKKLTLTQQCLKAKGLPVDTRVAIGDKPMPEN